MHTLPMQAWPGVHANAEPQPPQLFGSVIVFVQVPLQFVGVAAGQLETQANEPASTAAQRPASPSQATSQLPQLVAAVGLAQPPSHSSRPSGQPASAAPSSPGAGPASSMTTGPSSVATVPSSCGLGWEPASHPSAGQSAEE
jgi:hypothetical protein